MKWTKEEDEIIIKNQDLPIRELKKLLNRTEKAIYTRRGSLKITKTTRKWSDYDKQYLVDNIMKLSIEEICEALGRNKSSVYTMMCTIGIKKSIERTIETRRIIKIFCGMRDRCYKETLYAYKNYGARGIRICDEWLCNPDLFVEWSLNNGYANNLTIDRINNDLDYSPENCRWVDKTMQANNTRKNVYLTAFGETKTMAEWSRDPRCKCKYKTLFQRIKNYNMPIETAISLEVNNV